jgi:hypothetical protein
MREVKQDAEVSDRIPGNGRHACETAAYLQAPDDVRPDRRRKDIPILGSGLSASTETAPNGASRTADDDTRLSFCHAPILL